MMYMRAFPSCVILIAVVAVGTPLRIGAKGGITLRLA